jgi:poly(beta-D-mannuronate) lyase
MTKYIGLALLLGLVGPLSAAETLVKDVAEFDAAMKVAKPGDEIVLADGEWRDAKIVVRGEGDEKNPITVRAQTPGKVVFVGASTLRIGGELLVVRDLLWKDCEAESEVISFRVDSKNHANFCRMEACAVVGDRPAKGDRKWVSIYGEQNTVDQCRFEGKQSAGTLLVVWLGENQPPNRHKITCNFFGPRQKLGKNGGEIIRIGDSKTSMVKSGTIVACNYFYHCDGEAEIISNKSCSNLYDSNVFVGCSGALTLRHGNEGLVLFNAFFGDGRKGTGGVRVIGEGHEVSKNLFHRLEGDDTRAAVSLMNGIPGSALNGYFQVKDAKIAANTFIDCKQTFVVGLRDKDQKHQSLAPVGCSFVDNVVLAADRPVIDTRNAMIGARYESNTYHGEELGPEIAATEGEWRRLKERPEILIRKIFAGRGQDCICDCRPENMVRPSDVGPEWMRPGDEYLPAVWKAEGKAGGK